MFSISIGCTSLGTDLLKEAIGLSSEIVLREVAVELFFVEQEIESRVSKIIDRYFI
jgi:hypothetical protein